MGTFPAFPSHAAQALRLAKSLEKKDGLGGWVFPTYSTLKLMAKNAPENGIFGRLSPFRGEQPKQCNTWRITLPETNIAPENGW